MASAISDVVEAPDLVRQGVSSDGPPGEGLSENLLEAQDLVAARQLEDVDGSLSGRRAHDPDAVGDAPHGGGHARVAGVARGRGHERRLVHSDPLPGLGVVEVSHHDAQAEIVHTEGVLQLRHEERVGVVEGLEASDESRGHRIVVREEDVATGVGGELARRPRRGLRLHPRHVEELDEGEGQQDEHEHGPGEQDHDREQAPDIGVKGDVPKAEGRHHGQGPVDTGDPGVVVPLPLHQEVEPDGVDEDQGREDQGEAEEDAEVPPTPPAARGGHDLRYQELHDPPPGRGVSLTDPRGVSPARAGLRGELPCPLLSWPNAPNRPGNVGAARRSSRQP